MMNWIFFHVRRPEMKIESIAKLLWFLWHQQAPGLNPKLETFLLYFYTKKHKPKHIEHKFLLVRSSVFDVTKQQALSLSILYLEFFSKFSVPYF